MEVDEVREEGELSEDDDLIITEFIPSKAKPKPTNKASSKTKSRISNLLAFYENQNVDNQSTSDNSSTVNDNPSATDDQLKDSKLNAMNIFNFHNMASKQTSQLPMGNKVSGFMDRMRKQNTPFFSPSCKNSSKSKQIEQVTPETKSPVLNFPFMLPIDVKSIPIPQTLPPLPTVPPPTVPEPPIEAEDWKLIEQDTLDEIGDDYVDCLLEQTRQISKDISQMQDKTEVVDMELASSDEEENEFAGVATADAVEEEDLAILELRRAALASYLKSTSNGKRETKEETNSATNKTVSPRSGTLGDELRKAHASEQKRVESSKSQSPREHKGRREGSSKDRGREGSSKERTREVSNKDRVREGSREVSREDRGDRHRSKEASERDKRLQLEQRLRREEARRARYAQAYRLERQRRDKERRQLESELERLQRTLPELVQGLLGLVNSVPDGEGQLQEQLLKALTQLQRTLPQTRGRRKLTSSRRSSGRFSTENAGIARSGQRQKTTTEVQKAASNEQATIAVVKQETPEEQYICIDSVRGDDCQASIGSRESDDIYGDDLYSNSAEVVHNKDSSEFASLEHDIFTSIDTPMPSSNQNEVQAAKLFPKKIVRRLQSMRTRILSENDVDYNNDSKKVAIVTGESDIQNPKKPVLKSEDKAKIDSNANAITQHQVEDEAKDATTIVPQTPALSDSNNAANTENNSVAIKEEAKPGESNSVESSNKANAQKESEESDSEADILRAQLLASMKIREDTPANFSSTETHDSSSQQERSTVAKNETAGQYDDEEMMLRAQLLASLARRRREAQDTDKSSEKSSSEDQSKHSETLKQAKAKAVGKLDDKIAGKRSSGNESRSNYTKPTSEKPNVPSRSNDINRDDRPKGSVISNSNRQGQKYSKSSCTDSDRRTQRGKEGSDTEKIPKTGDIVKTSVKRVQKNTSAVNELSDEIVKVINRSVIIKPKLPPPVPPPPPPPPPPNSPPPPPPPAPNESSFSSGNSAMSSQRFSSMSVIGASNGTHTNFSFQDHVRPGPLPISVPNFQNHMIPVFPSETNPYMFGLEPFPNPIATHQNMHSTYGGNAFMNNQGNDFNEFVNPLATFTNDRECFTRTVPNTDFRPEYAMQNTENSSFDIQFENTVEDSMDQQRSDFTSNESSDGDMVLTVGDTPPKVPSQVRVSKKGTGNPKYRMRREKWKERRQEKRLAKQLAKRMLYKYERNDSLKASDNDDTGAKPWPTLQLIDQLTRPSSSSNMQAKRQVPKDLPRVAPLIIRLGEDSSSEGESEEFKRRSTLIPEGTGLLGSLDSFLKQARASVEQGTFDSETPKALSALGPQQVEEYRRLRAEIRTRERRLLEARAARSETPPLRGNEMKDGDSGKATPPTSHVVLTQTGDVGSGTPPARETEAQGSKSHIDITSMPGQEPKNGNTLTATSLTVAVETGSLGVGLIATQVANTELTPDLSLRAVKSDSLLARPAKAATREAKGATSAVQSTAISKPPSAEQTAKSSYNIQSSSSSIQSPGAQGSNKESASPVRQKAAVNTKEGKAATLTSTVTSSVPLSAETTGTENEHAKKVHQLELRVQLHQKLLEHDKHNLTTLQDLTAKKRTVLDMAQKKIAQLLKQLATTRKIFSTNQQQIKELEEKCQSCEKQLNDRTEKISTLHRQMTTLGETAFGPTYIPFSAQKHMSLGTGSQSDSSTGKPSIGAERTARSGTSLGPKSSAGREKVKPSSPESGKTLIVSGEEMERKQLEKLHAQYAALIERHLQLKAMPEEEMPRRVPEHIETEETMSLSSNGATEDVSSPVIGASKKRRRSLRDITQENASMTRPSLCKDIDVPCVKRTKGSIDTSQHEKVASPLSDTTKSEDEKNASFTMPRGQQLTILSRLHKEKLETDTEQAERTFLPHVSEFDGRKNSSTISGLVYNCMFLKVPTLRECSTEKLKPYTSMLRNFKSYRFSPFYRTKSELSLTSLTYANKIDCRRKFCRYDLTGTCNDDKCPWQHVRGCSMTIDEQLADLVSYAPKLAGISSNSTTTDPTNPQHSAAIKKFVSEFRAKHCVTDHQQLVLMVGLVNSALKHVAPHTTFTEPRVWRPHFTNDSPDSDTEENEERSSNTAATVGGKEAVVANRAVFEDDIVWSGDARYYAYSVGGASESAGAELHDMEAAVLEQPTNVPLWIKLAYHKLQDHHYGGYPARLDQALNVLSLGLESCRTDSDLWLHYLRLYSRRSDRAHLPELCAHALEHAPSYALHWKYLSVLTTPTEQRKHLLRIDAFIRDESEKTPRDLVSHRLLEVLLYRLQLDVISGRLALADKLCSDRCTMLHTLSLKDAVLLCLCRVYLLQYMTLPSSLLDPTISQPSRLVSKEPPVVLLPVTAEVNTLTTLVQLITACQQHPGYREDREALLPLYSTLWLHLNNNGQKLSAKDMASKLALSVSPTEPAPLYLVKLQLQIMSREDPELIQLYSSALAQAPADFELVGGFAELLVEQGQHPRACKLLREAPTAFLNSSAQPRHLYASLLRLPTPEDWPLNEPLPQRNDVTLDCDPLYVWRCYCLLLEVEWTPVDTVEDNYETALASLTQLAQLRSVWKCFLEYSERRVRTAVTDDSRRRLFTAHTSLLRRCLLCLPSRVPVPHRTDTYWTDYSWHTKLAEEYIACLDQEAHRSRAYEELVQAMPDNISLLLRACAAWERGGARTLALGYSRLALDRFPTCQPLLKLHLRLATDLSSANEVLQVYRAATEALPFSRWLWTNYLVYAMLRGRESLVRSILRRASRLGLPLYDLARSLAKQSPPR